MALYQSISLYHLMELTLFHKHAHHQTYPMIIASKLLIDDWYRLHPNELFIRCGSTNRS